MPGRELSWPSTVLQICGEWEEPTDDSSAMWVCVQELREHKGQHGRKEVFLEKVTPKLSNQEEYGKTTVGRRECQGHVVGEQPVDAQCQVQTAGALNARIRAWT